MHPVLFGGLLLMALAGREAAASAASLGIVAHPEGGSIAYDMNAKGQVAAVIDDGKGSRHAVFADKGKPFKLITPEGTKSEARRINDKGEVVGSARSRDGSWFAFVYSEADGMRRIGTLGGASSYGMGINDAGAAVGYADTANGEWHAFLSVPGKALLDLGTLGGKFSYAKDINNAGQIVGAATTRDGYRHAFLYDPERGMIDLGTLGGRVSTANAINDRGVVVGTSEMRDGRFHAFVYDGTRMIDLGAIIGHGDSFAADINNAGDVVGTVELSNERYGDRRISFVWQNDRMSLHPSGKALYLTHAISDAGHVIGATYDRGLDAATMPSHAAPFVDHGGEKILSFFAFVLLIAGAAAIIASRGKVSWSRWPG